MPKIDDSPSKRHVTANSKPKSRVNQQLSKLPIRRSGTDEIEIASGLPVPGEKKQIELTTAMMSDAAKVIANVRYLLRQWIAYGMLTGVIAEPGIGKSAWVLYALVRVIVTGCNWFNEMKGPAKSGHVLWCGTENDIAITLQRMRDWKIPMGKIVLPFEDPLATINLLLTEHLERIEQLIVFYKIKLVVIDSLRGSHDDDENNSRVGRVLKELSAIAERTGAAIVVVHHTKKLMADEEITANSSRGSNVILAMMRSQIGIDKPDPKSKWCRVRVLKENLGIAPKPVGFQVTSTGLEFGAVPERPRKQTQKDDAADWLRQRMMPGKTYKASAIESEAEQVGHSIRTVRKAAAEKLGIKPKQVRNNGKIVGWTWKLP